MFIVQSMVLSTFDRKATSPGVESWGHNGLGPAFRPFKLIDCAEDLKLANFLGITFSFSSPPLPLPLNVLGLYWCETLVPRAVDILLYWTDGVASILKAFQGLFWLCGWLQCRVSIPSTNLIAPLHILHWRLKTFSRVNMCRPQVIRTHIFCALVLGLQTSAYVHFGLASCTFTVLNALTMHICAYCAHLCTIILCTMHGLHVLAATSDLDCTV